MSLPPGPSAPLWLQSIRWLRHPIDFLEGCEKKYGDTFTVRWAGYGNVVVTISPTAIKQIFTGDPKIYHAGNRIVGPLLGSSSLFLLDEEAHLRQRRLLLSPMRGERMHAYAGVITECTEQNMRSWPRDQPFFLHDKTREITLDIIMRSVFGLARGPRFARMFELLTELTNFISTPMSLAFTFLLGPRMQEFLQRDFGPLGWSARFHRLRREVDHLLFEEIDSRRSEKDSSRQDVLSLLLDERDASGKPMTPEELRDELMTLLIAGHETTAGGLAWAFEHILADRQVLEHIRKELTESGHGALNAERLARLTYLDAVITETLRLRPVLPLVARQLMEPVTLDQWSLPAGTTVAPCIYLAHRRADFFADPQEFKPERFLDQRPDPYHWFPFGGGVRRCIGAAFSLYEMKSVIANILSRTQLELVSQEPARVARRSVTFVPDGGTQVIQRAS